MEKIKIQNELRNIGLFGITYETHRIWKRLGIIRRQPLKDIKKRQIFFECRPDRILEEIEKTYYTTMHGRKLNLLQPERFTEKIQWMKLYDSTPIKTRLADKFQARSWVGERIGEEHLIPIYGVWDDFDEIDFGSLPDEFVLKCNHGCGSNLVVRDKRKMDVEEAREEFRYSMEINYAYHSMELHYRDIPRKIIAEQYIEESGGGLCDYKVHCFGGEPKFIQIIGDRDLTKHTGYQRLYDFEWKDLGWTFETYPKFPSEIPRPGCLDDIYRCARILSRDFNYVRADFYVVDGRVLFGEMTFTPGSGYYPYSGSWTEEKDYLLGSWIRMPEEKYELLKFQI